MGAPTTWLFPLVVLIGLFSLSFAHPPLTVVSTVDDVYLRNVALASKDSSLKARDGEFPLGKRGKTGTVYTKTEQQNLRILAQSIDTYVLKGDIVFFIGNGGSYLMNPFDTTKYDMIALPVSDPGKYKNPGFIPTAKGLEKYYDDIIYPTMGGKTFERIILVGTSRTGGKADSVRQFLLDAYEASVNKHKGKTDGAEARETFSKISTYFINVDDSSKVHESTKPKDVTVLASLTTGNDGFVSNLLGNVKKYPRMEPEYPFKEWETSVKDSWKKNEAKAAENLRKEVRQWNKDNGGLIGSTEQEAQAQKDPNTRKKKKTGSTIALKIIKYAATT